MTRPGVRLRAWLAERCSDKTMRQCIDPAVADLQTEYRDARIAGAAWRSRWIRVTGCVGILKAALACAWRTSTDTMMRWPAAERRAIGLAIGWSALATIAIVALLVTLESRKYMAFTGDIGFAMYLVPFALAVAMPAGLLLGIPGVLGTQRPSTRVLAAAMLLGLACTAVAIVNVGWVTPASNQTFREQILIAVGWELPIPRGYNELSLNELWRQGLRVDILQRVAVALAPMPVLLVALSIRTRTRTRAVAAGVASTVAWWAATMGAASMARNMPTPMIVVFLMPHVLFALLGMWNLHTRSAEAASSQ